jgi:hypothetical protein
MPSKKKQKPTPGKPVAAIEFGQIWIVITPEPAVLWTVEDEVRLVSPKFIEDFKTEYDEALQSVIIIRPNPGVDPDKFLRHLSKDGYLNLKKRTLAHSGAVQTRSWVSPEVLDAQ